MKVFVYGTLMRGFGSYDNYLKGRSEFIGLGETKPEYRMLSLGGYPGIVDGNTAVKGEVFEITADVRADLDRLEGHPDFYIRTPIVLANGQKVEAYILANMERSRGKYAEVKDGDWRKYKGFKA